MTLNSKGTYFKTWNGWKNQYKYYVSVWNYFQKIEIAPDKIILKVKIINKQNVPSGYILLASPERVNVMDVPPSL